MSLGHCLPGSFSMPTVLGCQFISLQASLVTEYTNYPDVYVFNATFCNVTVSYTHPGQDDRITIEAWLPELDKWNGRFQAQGGSGWSAGRTYLSYQGMAGAMGDGYATATTDAGVPSPDIAGNPGQWGLISNGNTNLFALQNFGSIAYGEEALIAKQLMKSYYGSGPIYSYWNGCSQGGRQGLMIAQRYPDAYDGIIAAAPAVYFDLQNQVTSWPGFYMQQTGQFPFPCELRELTNLAVKACDKLDGIEDGLIGDTVACAAVFNPFKKIGTSFNCTDTNTLKRISYAAAAVANASWSGPRSAEGQFSWFGPDIGHDLAAYTGVTCSNGTCAGPGYSVTTLVDYLTVSKDATNPKLSYTWKEYDHVWRSFSQQYASLIRSADADLRPFRDSGGKIITFHGTADEVVPGKATLYYWTQVAATTPNIQNFYKYYQVPGLNHCFGGKSGQPTSIFDQLRAWVENGTVPDSSPVTVTLPNGTTVTEAICPFPKKAVRRPGSNGSKVPGWVCLG
ncbi:Tannase/feruloyl esterase [Cladochytrium replicatum]|nr:Tannase/feruloyl esterase [Cladochytrium replicatum]